MEDSKTPEEIEQDRKALAAARAREWRKNNPDKVKAHEANRAKDPEAFARRKAKQAEYAKKYVAEHREALAAYSREWRAKNPGKASEYVRRWEKKNPDKVKERDQLRDQNPVRKTKARDRKRKAIIEQPDRILTNRLKQYGIDAEQYKQLSEEQHHRCAICLAPEMTKGIQRLSVDHCHTTLKVRGLLCSNCNNGLGRFLDEPALLEAAAAYLRKHQS